MECKIQILDHVFYLLFYVLVSVSHRVANFKNNLPFTVSCVPLIMTLLHKFAWYRSFYKPFKTPQHIVQYILNLLIICLVVNYCIRRDGYANLDVIAHLWPCYGLIALSFVLFAAGILLFISTACNHFTGDEDEEDPRYIDDDTGTMSCSVATGIFLNTSYFLAFTILGFMALLKEVKNEGVFDLAYIALVVCASLCSTFMLSQIHSIIDWYYTRLLLPQISSEL